jgi:hypothetical protein
MGGSPFWQTAFLCVGLVFLIWQTWRGWRAGLFRSGVNLAAILLCFVLGSLTAELAAAPFGGLRYLPGFIVGVVVGGGLGLFLFFAIWLIGALTFKQTEHYAFGPLSFIWRVGGALFGFLIGLALLLGSISIVRSLGALLESRVEGRELAEAPDLQARLTVGLVQLKKSLELGPMGPLLASADPLPPQFHRLAAQIGTLISDQEKMQRFLEYPRIQEVLQNPRIAKLFSDPDMVRAWQDKNVVKILNNQAVAAALKDPVVAEQLRKVDLSAALKFALESPQPSPSPSPSRSPKKHR